MLGSQLGVNLNVLAWLFAGPANAIIGPILHLTGNT
jgi:hypothetical protein